MLFILNLIIDTKEGNRKLHARHFFEDKVDNIEEKELVYGDYVFFNDKYKVAFEYKEATDFLQSVISKRVFEQAIGLNDTYDFHFVIIESQNIRNAIYKSQFNSKIRYDLGTYEGAIERLSVISTPIEVYTGSRINPKVKNTRVEKKCFEKMLSVTKRCLDLRTQYYKSTIHNSNNNPIINFLCQIKGIGVNVANDIVETYEIKDWVDFLNLTKEELIKINYVNEDKAEKILKSRGFLNE